MRKSVRVDPEAVEEMAAAMDWYDGERPGLGAEFFDEAREAIRSLERPGVECRPVLGVPSDLGAHRKLLRRFPYLVVFVELEAHIRVLAVAHAKRRPGYWLERI